MRRRKYKVHLVTFSDGQLQYSTAQQRLVRSALESGGVDYAYAHSPKDIPSEFYARHREILDLSRGGGYWLWKPFFILQRLAAVANGDFVIYWDAGRGKGYKFCRAVDPLLEWADSAGDGAIPGVSIPVYGSNAKWTKRDCFVYMDCDNERFWQHPQIQATYSVWKKTTATMDFVATWLRYCGDPRIITDAPNTCGLNNLPGFVEHRWDQSVLTNLVIKSGRPFLDGSFTPSKGLLGWLQPPANWNAGFLKNPNNNVLLAKGWSAGTVYGMTFLRHRFPRLLPSSLADQRWD